MTGAACDPQLQTLLIQLFALPDDSFQFSEDGNGRPCISLSDDAFLYVHAIGERAMQTGGYEAVRAVMTSMTLATRMMGAVKQTGK